MAAAPKETTGMNSEVLTDDADVFKRGRKANPSKFQPDVKASLDNAVTRRIQVGEDEDLARTTINGLRKAARELSCSLQVKTIDGYVVFRAKPKPKPNPA